MTQESQGAETPLLSLFSSRHDSEVTPYSQEETNAIQAENKRAVSSYPKELPTIVQSLEAEERVKALQQQVDRQRNKKSSKKNKGFKPTAVDPVNNAITRIRIPEAVAERYQLESNEYELTHAQVQSVNNGISSLMHWAHAIDLSEFKNKDRRSEGFKKEFAQTVKIAFGSMIGYFVTLQYKQNDSIELERLVTQAINKLHGDISKHSQTTDVVLIEVSPRDGNAYLVKYFGQNDHSVPYLIGKGSKPMPALEVEQQKVVNEIKAQIAITVAQTNNLPKHQKKALIVQPSDEEIINTSALAMQKLVNEHRLLTGSTLENPWKKLLELLVNNQASVVFQESNANSGEGYFEVAFSLSAKKSIVAVEAPVESEPEAVEPEIAPVVEETFVSNRRDRFATALNLQIFGLTGFTAYLALFTSAFLTFSGSQLVLCYVIFSSLLGGLAKLVNSRP